MTQEGDETSAPIEYVSEVRENPFPDAWYRLTGPDHFWFQWRFAAALRQIHDLALPDEPGVQALEIGCGTGVLRDQLESRTQWVVDITDLHLEALRLARPGRGRKLYYDILEERPGFVKSYDVVVLFDVLEHINDTAPFLRSVVRHLKPGGALLVNVPALQWLAGAYDQAAGHIRRYDKRSLAGELEGQELELLNQRYWGLSLVPLLAARNLVLALPQVSGEEAIIRTGFRPPGRLAHALLRGLMRLETALRGGGMPAGSSLLMAARRGV